MGRGNLIEEQLVHSVIGAFYDSYNELGFGFLEEAYTRALTRELAKRGHLVRAKSARRSCTKEKHC